ncbi:aquaporin AQPcic-like isoform X1 [Glossina fuscipes]|uniref:Aquaporin AQPcic-like isoform X1 n=3 Tax=Nemorhina TaxID=44051 RepID=A0A8U0W605_9MUSC|nr:aquaporin AQPcic-like isoform X1 [Glossina fuscipes]KAI9586780.1 hypothetical protein GQX74_002627 [Glossina fuscipes]
MKNFLLLTRPFENGIIVREHICCFLSEFFGTGMLLFFGCMGCVYYEVNKYNQWLSALNFGLVVLIVVQCFGCCSGAHLNPVITIAAWIYNMLSAFAASLYILAQFTGAYCGYALLHLLLPSSLCTPNLCMTTLRVDITVWQAIGIEFCTTVALVWVTCAVWDPRNIRMQDSAAIRIGLTISALALAAGPLTGASMNPARSLAPAIWHNSYDHHWIYWLSPIMAGIFAASFYRVVFRREVDSADINNPKLEAIQIP